MDPDTVSIEQWLADHPVFLPVILLIVGAIVFFVVISRESGGSGSRANPTGPSGNDDSTENEGMPLKQRGEPTTRQALAQADDAIDQDPEDPELYVKRGGLRMEAKDYRGALDDLNHALERGAYKGSSSARRRKNAAQDKRDASPSYDSYQWDLPVAYAPAPASAPPPPPDMEADADDVSQLARLYQSLALTRIALGDFRGALIEIDQSIATESNNTPEDLPESALDAMLIRSWIKTELGNSQGAARDLEIISKTQKKIAEECLSNKDAGIPAWLRAAAFALRGQITLAAGDAAASVEDFTEATSLQQNNPAYWRSVIGAHFLAGNRERALELAYKAATLMSAQYDLSQILPIRSVLLRAGGDKEAAVADMDRLVELNSDTSDAWHFRGDRRHQMGDSEGALADYSKAALVEEFDADAHLKSALIHRERGESDKALAALDRAISISPHDVVARLFRYRVRVAAGQTDEAESDLNEARRISPYLAERFSG